MVPLEDTLKAAIERLKRHKRRELPIRLDGSCSVHADPLLLHQAFYNILDNAIKYAGPDAPIEVECSTEGDRCHVVVADHGPGLPREDWKLIFQKFQGSAVTDRKNSTGLGLYITKGFIEAMGGSIRARDRRDRASGLEIWIELPRAH
jgi:two-component system sensor histidine kinase KdpD